MCRNRQRRLSASDSSRVALEVSTTNGVRSAVMVPSSGTVTAKSDSTSSSRPSISMSALSVSSISSTVGLGAPDGGQQRPGEQELLAEHVVLVWSQSSGPGLNTQYLLGVVPLVERAGLVDALVALQTDQPGAGRLRDGAGQLGLADPGRALPPAAACRAGRRGKPRSRWRYRADSRFRPAADRRRRCRRTAGQAAQAHSLLRSPQQCQAGRVWPSPQTIHLVEVNSGRPIGPRACSFWVEMPISAPNPNCSPSVNAVEALTITAAASTPSVNRWAAAMLVVTMASVCPVPYSLMCAIASSTPSTTATAMSIARYSRRRWASSGSRCTVTPASCSAADQPRHRLVGDRGVDQQRLGGIAHAWATGLGVQQDPFGHLEVGGVVHVDVAIADAGLDGRHMRVADHRVDQACSPARDHHVDQAAGLDQVGDSGAVGGREQLDGVGGQVLARPARHAAPRPARRWIWPPTRCPQQRGVAGLERQTERVDGDVGPALVDHPDHAERNPLLTQCEPVGQRVAAQHLTDRVGQPGDLAQPGGDSVDALRVQRQAGRASRSACRRRAPPRDLRRWPPGPGRCCATIASAATSSAWSFATVGSEASTRAATRARRAASCTCWRTSGAERHAHSSTQGNELAPAPLRRPSPASGQSARQPGICWFGAQRGALDRG